MERLMIGELAKQSRVNLETIRYYERQGLIEKPPRAPSGYRIFSPDVAQRVRFIKRAQELGFSLKEIKELLDLRLAPDSTCADVRERAEAKLADINKRINALQAMKKALSRLTDACSGRGAVSECTILESLSNGLSNIKKKEGSR